MAEIAHLEAAHDAFEEGGEAQGTEDERDVCPSEESADELWHQQEQEDEDEQQQQQQQQEEEEEEEEQQELSPGLVTAPAQSPPLPPQQCELRTDSDAVAAQLLLAADDESGRDGGRAGTGHRSGGPQPQPVAPSPLPPHSRLHPTTQQARSPLLQRKLAVPKQLRRGRGGGPGGGRVPNPPRDIMPKWSSEEEAVEEEAGAGVAVPQPKAARARGSVAARQPRPHTVPATAAAARSRTAAHAAARGVATAAAPHRRVARATAPKAAGSGAKLGVASGGKKRKPKKKKAVAAVAVAAVAKALPVASAAARPVTAPARRSSGSGAPAPLKPAPGRAGASLAGAALAARGAPRLPKADPVARFQQVQQQWAKKQAEARRRQREVQDSVRRDMRMAAAMAIAPRRTKPAKPSPDFVAPSEKRRDALRMRVRRQMQTTQLATTTMTGTRLL
jgi:hypothetical protein